MAIRPVFIATYNPKALVLEQQIEFKWFPGLSKSQKQKSINSLHQAILNQKKKFGIENVLEISTKSNNKLGVALSAFNLSYELPNSKRTSVECIFQSSKVFENGGPYIELLDVPSIEAKKFEKLKTSGKLLYFKRKNEIWELEPKTLFYDWIYLNTLRANKDLAEEVLKYNAFTDIEFNPKKSINCQAASVALFVALRKTGLLDEVLKSKKTFTEFMLNQHSREKTKLF